MFIIALSYEVAKTWETILPDKSIGRILSKLEYFFYFVLNFNFIDRSKR